MKKLWMVLAAALAAPAGAQQPPAPALAVLAPPAPTHEAAARDTPTTRPAPAPSAAPATTGVESGISRLRLSGLLQTWFADGSGDARGTFRIRRAEIRVTGELSPATAFTVMVDPAKAASISSTHARVDGTEVETGSRVNPASLLLQDAFLTLGFRGVSVDAGQFRLPLGLEGTQPPSRLDLVEPALFATAGGYAGARDVGVLARGALGRGVEFRAGLFNGAGESQNSVDGNDSKVAVGRLVAHPLRGLQLGTWALRGDAGSEPATHRARVGADVLYARGPLTIKGEVARGRDGGIERLGYYAQAGARRHDVEVIGRFDAWDPDTHAAGTVATVLERDWIGGVNWFLPAPGAKLQANFVHKGMGGVAASRNVILVNLQVAW